MNRVILTILMCFASVHSFYYEIHKNMTADEIQRVFHTTEDNVPNYQLADITLSQLTKRDTGMGQLVNIKTREQEIALLLEPIDGVLAHEGTPVTTAEWNSTDGKVYYVQHPEVMEEVGRLMEDIQKAATMIICEGKVGPGYIINGYIGASHLAVKSLPDEVVTKLPDGHQGHRHVIYSVTPPEIDETHPRCGFQVPELSNLTNYKTGKSSENTEIPDIIYPEILAIADSSIYRLLDSDLVQTLQYMLILWNSVDLRNRNLDKPKIRINIARFIVGLVPQATPYIAQTLERQNDNKLDVVEVLIRAANAFLDNRNEFPLTDSDFIILMTKYALRLRTGVDYLGYARSGNSCYQTNTSSSAAVFTDKGRYYSWTPAHELGHLLGMGHDGLTPGCQATDGYIMSPAPMSTDKSWNFSTCSITQMHLFFRRGRAQCLLNVPNMKGKRIPRILPSAILSIDEQCRKVIGTEGCKLPNKLTGDQICQHLLCKHRWRDEVCWKQEFRPPLDGSPCGDDKICLQGRCISQHSEAEEDSSGTKSD